MAQQDTFDWDEPVVLTAAPTRLSYRDGLVEQIMRDIGTLKEDPAYHSPSTQFYIDRIRSYREAVREIDDKNTTGESDSDASDAGRRATGGQVDVRGSAVEDRDLDQPS